MKPKLKFKKVLKYFFFSFFGDKIAFEERFFDGEYLPPYQL